MTGENLPFRVDMRTDGLCNADDIAPLRGNRNSLGLDRSGSDVFFIRKSAVDRLCEAEFVK